MNTFHQIVKLLCVLGTSEDVCEILLGCHRVHRLADLCQFSGSHRASGSALDPGGVVLLLQFFLSVFFVEIIRRNRFAEWIRKLLDPRRQRFNGLAIDSPPFAMAAVMIANRTQWAEVIPHNYPE